MGQGGVGAPRAPHLQRLGLEPELDRNRGFSVTDSGIVVIANSDGVEHLEECVV